MTGVQTCALPIGRDDTKALKREIMGQFERLEIPVPATAPEARAFLTGAIKKLTGIDLTDGNLMKIVAALVDIEDKKAAYHTVFEVETAAQKSN